MALLKRLAAKISAWRTEARDGRPSDRTFEGNELEITAAQGVAGLEINLTSNLTAKADSMRYDLIYMRIYEKIEAFFCTCPPCYSIG